MNIRIIARPVWIYLNQQISNDRSVWNLKRFWYLYRIDLLKKCWQQDFSHKSRPYH